MLLETDRGSRVWIELTGIWCSVTILNRAGKSRALREQENRGEGSEREGHSPDQHVCGGDIGGFVGPDGCRAQQGLQENDPAPGQSQFCRDMLGAELPPGLPGAETDSGYNTQGHQTVEHLQPDLDRGDWVERDDFEAVPVVLGNGAGIHGWPKFAVRERKIG